MFKAAKKIVTRFLASVLFALVLPGFVLLFPPRPACAGASLHSPYSIGLAFYQAQGEAALALPGVSVLPAAFLAVTVSPEHPDIALYASRSQIQGKATELGVWADGSTVLPQAVFPRGAEKPDPLEPGKTTRIFEGAFMVLVPLPKEALAAQTVDVHLAGLACSPVNCTPLNLTRTIPVPDAATLATLPDAASSPWWDSLLSGVAEPLAAMSAPSGATPSRFAVAPLTPSLNGKGIPLTPRADAFLSAITPVPFSPELEVTSVGKAILLGFLAGIILNLMPCVLPILGIKLATLLSHGGNTPEGLRRFRRHQIFFALGILTWFMVLAGLFHFLDLAWGQIFQSPEVVFALAAVLVLLALNLFGLFSLPLIDLRAGNAKNPNLRAFAEGFGATLLATPCGGPLLGGVLSWALLQPLGTLTLTLEWVGLGMAFPYLLLAAFPSLARCLPRPGEWMRTMEQVIGFLLLGTVAYLVGFLPLDILPRVLASLVLMAFGVWLWPKRMAARLFGLVCILTACVWPFLPQAGHGEWKDYSHMEFADVLGKRPILVDFTADWCPTCKVVEATALRENTLRTWQSAYGLSLFRVDMTRENPEGEALLRAVGSVSIPVIAVFPAGEKAFAPFVLRDIVTSGQIAAALSAAASN